MLSLVLLVGTRLLHLCNTSSHWIINADSFYFHYRAIQLHSGLSVPLQYSGITYLLAIEPTIMSLFAPILLSLVTAMFLYCITKHYYSSAHAICAVFCFAICIPAIFVGSAGNLDRDSLELLMIIPILFCIYQVGKGPAKPFIFYSALAILLLAVLSYLWSYVAIAVVACLVAPFVFYQAYRRHRYYRMMALVLPILIAAYVGLSYQDYGRLLYHGISEMQYLDITGLVMYIPLILPLVYGIIVLRKRKTDIDLFLLSWFATAFMLGLMISRLQLFLIPAVCIVSGIGMYQFYADNKEEYHATQ